MEIDLELLQAFCDEAGDMLGQWEMVCIECTRNPAQEQLVELFRYAHNLKGSSRAVGLGAFGEFVHHIEDLIVLLRDGKLPVTESAISILLDAQGLMCKWVSQVRSDPAFAPNCDELLNRAKQIAGSPSGAAPAVNPPAELAAAPVPAADHPGFSAAEERAPSPQSSAPQASPKSKTAQQGDTIRISAGKLDQILQIIGELSIHQSIVWHSRAEVQKENKLFQNSVQLSQKLTKELYDRALSLRMQPLQTVFQRLERNIFEISKALGKEVDVHISGGDVELDKTVIEKIIDPLTHIVRNAIDHGVEAPEVRAECGKDKKGKIEVQAKQDAFGVEILIRDDGKGLAADRILQKAVEKGLVHPDRKLSQSETWNLIFLPGFSTAEKVTDVSGRGVGMDVVRKSLEELRGSIAIESQEGNGTSFCITLPTSVSIIETLLVTLDGEKYVLPIDSIVEVINIDAKKWNEIPAMINHGGAVLPTYLLGELFYRAGRVKATPPQSQADDRRSILVCKDGNQKIGLIAGKVLGQHQVVVRPLSTNISNSFGLMGGTVLGNGEPGLIVDIPKIVKHVLEQRAHQEKAA